MKYSFLTLIVRTKRDFFYFFKKVDNIVHGAIKDFKFVLLRRITEFNIGIDKKLGVLDICVQNCSDIFILAKDDPYISQFKILSFDDKRQVEFKGRR